MPDQLSSPFVKASPTKRFFIAVLIKDIQFMDAIVELIDNSVDAARSHRLTGDLSGLSIDVDFDADKLVIRDNAGGMPIAQAINYAFRFGRSDDAPSTPGSVGEFGVGMKRALFKVGRNFMVRSTTVDETFLVSVDVNEWQSEEESPGEWTFPMPESGANFNSLPVGTEITVTNLYDYAKDQISSTSFGTRLSGMVREKHAVALTEGLNITIGTNSLQAQAARLSQSTQIRPLKISKRLPIEGAEVDVTIIAGIAERKLEDTGWYIFCNDRMIERAEQSEKTGWQTALVEGERKAPKAHWQFAHFRGYVLFRSNKASVLPWNTTKTGLNVEAPAFRQVRADMNAAMREVIDFLNLRENEGNDGPMDLAIKGAPLVALSQLPDNPRFTYTATTSGTPKPSTVRISFECDPNLYEAVRAELRVKSKTEVGRGVFDYYVQAEGIDG